jgi:hypothetical protein
MSMPTSGRLTFKRPLGVDFDRENSSSILLISDYIVGRAEMGTDTTALRAKLLQLMRGQEAVQAFRNGLRFGV